MKLSTSVLHSPLYAIAALQRGLQEIVLLFRGVRTIFGKDHESHLSSFARPSLKKNLFQPISERWCAHVIDIHGGLASPRLVLAIDAWFVVSLINWTLRHLRDERYLENKFWSSKVLNNVAHRSISFKWAIVLWLQYFCHLLWRWRRFVVGCAHTDASFWEVVKDVVWRRRRSGIFRCDCRVHDC